MSALTAICFPVSIWITICQGIFGFFFLQFHKNTAIFSVYLYATTLFFKLFCFKVQILHSNHLIFISNCIQLTVEMTTDWCYLMNNHREPEGLDPRCDSMKLCPFFIVMVYPTQHLMAWYSVVTLIIMLCGLIMCPTFYICLFSFLLLLLFYTVQNQQRIPGSHTFSATSELLLSIKKSPTCVQLQWQTYRRHLDGLNISTDIPKRCLMFINMFSHKFG